MIRRILTETVYLAVAVTYFAAALLIINALLEY